MDPRNFHPRVGMVIQIDPTPFLLLEGTDSKTVEPKTSSNFLTEAAKVGILKGPINLTRIYLPDNESRNFFQISSEGELECRYFTHIDEIIPASDDDWGVWLNETEGLLGGPQIQTPDEKVYVRVWAPSDKRINPVSFIERIKDLHSESERKLSSCLYLKDKEFLLVELIEQEDSVSINIYAGIDIEPLSLELS